MQTPTVDYRFDVEWSSLEPAIKAKEVEANCPGLFYLSLHIHAIINQDIPLRDTLLETFGSNIEDSLKCGFVRYTNGAYGYMLGHSDPEKTMVVFVATGITNTIAQCTMIITPVEMKTGTKVELFQSTGDEYLVGLTPDSMLAFIEEACNIIQAGFKIEPILLN